MAQPRLRAFARVNAVSFALLLLARPSPALAIELPNLSGMVETQAREVSRTFAAAIAMKPLEPASNFGISRGKEGKSWGLSAGLVISEVTAIKLKEFFPSTSVPFIPAAMLIVAVGTPFYGLGIEIGALPRLTFEQISFEEWGFNAKWTFIDSANMKVPFDMALRGGLTKAGLNFAQKINTVAQVTVDVDYETFISSASALVSKSFLGLFEPYAGLGVFHQESTLASFGSATIFNTSVSITGQLKSKSTHLHFYSGFQITLPLLALGMEYNDIGGVNGYALKLALKY